MSMFDEDLATLEPTPFEFGFKFEDDLRHDFENGDWEAHAMFWNGANVAWPRKKSSIGWTIPLTSITRGKECFSLWKPGKRPHVWQLLGILRVRRSGTSCRDLRSAIRQGVFFLIARRAWSGSDDVTCAKTRLEQIIEQPYGQHLRAFRPARFCLRRPGMDIDMRQGLRPFGEAAQKQSPPEILLRSAKELEQVLVEKLINYIGTYF